MYHEVALRLRRKGRLAAAECLVRADATDIERVAQRDFQHGETALDDLRSEGIEVPASPDMD